MRPNASYRALDGEGLTALHRAARLGNIDWATALLEAGAAVDALGTAPAFPSPGAAWLCSRRSRFPRSNRHGPAHAAAHGRAPWPRRHCQAPDRRRGRQRQRRVQQRQHAAARRRGGWQRRVRRPAPPRRRTAAHREPRRTHPARHGHRRRAATPPAATGSMALCHASMPRPSLANQSFLDRATACATAGRGEGALKAHQLFPHRSTVNA